jgi:Osmosensitive K+ channel histidine kinase
MEKRIRTIWALSLASAILLICVQGYWLYNQYQHVVNTYAQELADKILLAGEKEYELRQNKIDASFRYVFKKEYVNASDSLRDVLKKNFSPQSAYGIKMEDFLNDSIMLDLGLDKSEYLDSMKTFMRNFYDSRKQEDESDASVIMWKTDSSGMFKKADSLSLFKNPKISKDDMPKMINRATTNYYMPFRKESLDSIIITDIPGVNFKMESLSPHDSVGVSTWWISGNLFSPFLKVLYFYSPYENKGVEINAMIPSLPLFKSMAVQFLLSLTLILLLTECLIMQIRTILKQKKINEMREDFVHAMIHELKRPVQTLKTFISFLGNKDMCSDELIKEQVIQDSMFELDNLSAYLKKLKDMIGADNDTTSLQISRFNLHELIDKVVRLVNLPSEKDVNISTCYEMESTLIDADMVHIANVVNNLIENAIKYSAQQVDIEIKAELKEQALFLTVSDNGIGVPDSEQEKVFTKFYRGSNFHDKNIPGIGLGLSYVKLIVEAHKGKVSLHSDIGKGTLVTICLPQN